VVILVATFPFRLFMKWRTILILTVFLGIASVAASLVTNAYMLEYEKGTRNITPKLSGIILKTTLEKALDTLL
jgi:hypothetical protein